MKKVYEKPISKAIELDCSCILTGSIVSGSGNAGVSLQSVTDYDDVEFD